MFKFLKRKNKIETSSLNKKNNNWKTICSLSGGIVLGLGAVGGIAGSIVEVAYKYKLSDDYSNFYLCRYELDPYRNDDPTKQGVGATSTDAQITQLADNAANSFSHYLSSIGYTSAVKVTSEVYHGDGAGSEKVFVDAYIPKNEVKPGSDQKPSAGWDDGTTYYSEPEAAYINGINSNRISMVLDAGQDLEEGVADGTLPTAMVVNAESIISNPQAHIKVDKDNVNIQFDGDGNTTLNKANWFDNSAQSGFLYNYFSTNGTDGKDVTPEDGEIYILKDQDALINRMCFVLQCAIYGSSNSAIWKNKTAIVDPSAEAQSNYNAYVNNWQKLTENEQDWAKAVLTDSSSSNPAINYIDDFKLTNTDAGTGMKFYDFSSNMGGTSTVGDGKWYSGENSVWNNKMYENAMGSFFRFIDTKTYTKPDALTNNIPTPKPAKARPDGVAWDWMKPYVVAIINKGAATTKPDKYNENGLNAYFPMKNPNDSTSKSDIKNFGQYLSIKFNTEFDANQFKDAFTTYHFPMPVKNFDITTTVESTNNMAKGIINSDGGTGINGINGVITVSSNLNGNIFNKSAILASIISLVLVILIIGIIVSVIFRVPGVVAFLFSTFSTSMTLLFMVLAHNPITLGIIVGLIVGYILSMMSVFIFMQKLHKYVKREDNIVSGFKKAVNNSIFKIIDIHVLGVITGVCLTYFGIAITNMFALTLLLFSLFDILSMILWAGASACILLTKKTDTKTNLIFPKWYFVKNIIEVENTTFNDKKFETTYMPYYKRVSFGFINKCCSKIWNGIKKCFYWCKGKITQSKYIEKEKLVKNNNGIRINLFGLKKEVISATILVLIMIVGTILLFTIGSHSSYYFFGGTRVVIDNTNGGAQTIIEKLKQLGKFADLTKDGNFWYVYSSNTFDSSAIANVIGTTSIKYFVQRVGHITMGSYISKFAIVFLIASAIASAYGFFRVGWTGILPIFVGSLVAPLLALLAIFTFQLYIDTNIFLFIAVLYTLSLVMIFGYITNVDNRWTKHQKFDIKELKTAYNLETASSFRFYYLLVLGMITIALLALMLVSSTELIASFGFLIIGLICIVATMIIVIRPICFWSTVLRFIYNRRVGENNFFFKKNYDKIDEQNIDGINKFKKESIQL